MRCKIGWRGCRLGEVFRIGRAASCSAARISSRTEREEKQSQDKISQYDMTLPCRSAELFATVTARQLLQPRDLMRRLDRSILPCLACVPGTALLVIPIDHSESVAEGWPSPCHTPAQRESHAADGHYLKTISLRQPNQTVATVSNISTVEDNICSYSGFPVERLGSSRLLVFASGDTSRPVSLPQE